jgi:hypothetical protein
MDSFEQNSPGKDEIITSGKESRRHCSALKDSDFSFPANQNRFPIARKNSGSENADLARKLKRIQLFRRFERGTLNANAAKQWPIKGGASTAENIGEGSVASETK